MFNDDLKNKKLVVDFNNFEAHFEDVDGSDRVLSLGGLSAEDRAAKIKALTSEPTSIPSGGIVRID